MAITARQFRAQFPEFRTTPQAVIERGLSDALVQMNAAEWGDRLDAGQKYLAADLIASGPLGEKARLKKDNQQTVYRRKYMDLMRASIGGFRVT